MQHRQPGRLRGRDHALPERRARLQPERQPTAETCNGLDDNCNGASTRATRAAAWPATPASPGVCAAGTTALPEAAPSPATRTSAHRRDLRRPRQQLQRRGRRGQPGRRRRVHHRPVRACCAAGHRRLPERRHCTASQTQHPDPAPRSATASTTTATASTRATRAAAAACNTGKPGVCAAGTSTASTAAVAVRAEPTAPVTRRPATALDNDCNGTVDDGNPGGGASCNTGMPGVCGPGTQAVHRRHRRLQPERRRRRPRSATAWTTTATARSTRATPAAAAPAAPASSASARRARSQCQSGDRCSASARRGPTPEICNSGADEDCDGRRRRARGLCALPCPRTPWRTTPDQEDEGPAQAFAAPASDKVQTQGTFVLQAPGTIAPNTQAVTVRPERRRGSTTRRPSRRAASARGSGRSFSFADRTGAHGGIRTAKFSLKGDGVTVKYTVQGRRLERADLHRRHRDGDHPSGDALLRRRRHRTVSGNGTNGASAAEPGGRCTHSVSGRARHGVP